MGDGQLLREWLGIAERRPRGANLDVREAFSKTPMTGGGGG